MSINPYRSGSPFSASRLEGLPSAAKELEGKAHGKASLISTDLRDDYSGRISNASAGGPLLGRRLKAKFH
jgi:hypothetical protein